MNPSHQVGLVQLGHRHRSFGRLRNELRPLEENVLLASSGGLRHVTHGCLDTLFSDKLGSIKMEGSFSKAKIWGQTLHLLSVPNIEGNHFVTFKTLSHVEMRMELETEIRT